MFLRIPDSTMKELQDLSNNIVKLGEAMQARTAATPADFEIQELAHMVTQLARITQLQTQALRSIV